MGHRSAEMVNPGDGEPKDERVKQTFEEVGRVRGLVVRPRQSWSVRSNGKTWIHAPLQNKHELFMASFLAKAKGRANLCPINALGIGCFGADPHE